MTYYLRHSDWLNPHVVPEGMNLGMVNDPFRTALLKTALENEAKDKVVIDLGAGTGLLGMSALGHGASFVYFVEADLQMAYILENVLPKKLDPSKYKIIICDIEELTLQNFDGPTPDIVVSEFYGPRLFDEGYVNYTKHVRTLFPNVRFIPEIFKVEFYLSDVNFRLPIWPNNKLLLEHYMFMYKEKGFSSRKKLEYSTDNHVGDITFNANSQIFDNEILFTITEDKAQLLIGNAIILHDNQRYDFTTIGWFMDRSEFGKTFKVHFDVDNFFNPRKIELDAI